MDALRAAIAALFMGDLIPGSGVTINSSLFDYNLQKLLKSQLLAIFELDDSELKVPNLSDGLNDIVFEVRFFLFPQLFLNLI